MINLIPTIPPSTYAPKDLTTTVAKSEYGSIFNSVELTCCALSIIQKDRIFGSTNLKDYLKLIFKPLPEIIDAEFIKKDPLYAVIILMLLGDESEDLRYMAAEEYKKAYPQDKLVQSAFFFLKDPEILIAHHLIVTHQWICTDPNNTEFYKEQITGMFKGTITFDKGDMLTSQEVSAIQAQEADSRYSIVECLQEFPEGYQVTKQYSSPAMIKPKKSRLDDLFIKGRVVTQYKVIASNLKKLRDSSEIIESSYSLPKGSSYCIAVIGDNLSGTKKFIQEKFPESPLTLSTLDLNQALMISTSHLTDLHYEAMVVQDELLKDLSLIRAMLIEEAEISQSRFEEMINQNVASRKIIIEEIATASPEESIKQYRANESAQGRLIPTETMMTIESSLQNALRSRYQRIEIVKKHPHILYNLYCEGKLIATVKEGILTVQEEHIDLYQKLTPQPTNQ